jgi:hypothetical protein
MAAAGAPIPARASLIPIVSVIRTLRREVDQQIIVLTDKIPDLEVHLKEIEHASPGLLQQVLFVEGTSRNVEHLQACSICRCSVVLVMTPLIVAGGAAITAANGAPTGGGGGVYGQAVVEEDRPAVIAVLNVLHVLRSACSDPWAVDGDSTAGTPAAASDGAARQPFVVASIVHSSNALFLPTIPLGGAGATDYCTAGGVLLSGAIEMCSCIHSVLSPGIVPLWEAILGMHQGVTGAPLLYRRLPSVLPAPSSSAGAMRVDRGAASVPTMGTSPSALDKICLPAALEGLMFGDLFTSLYDSCGVITLGICRSVESCGSVDAACGGSSGLAQPTPTAPPAHIRVPLVLVLPPPSTQMRAGDELFVLQPLVLLSV